MGLRRQVSLAGTVRYPDPDGDAWGLSRSDHRRCIGACAGSRLLWRARFLISSPSHADSWEPAGLMKKESGMSVAPEKDRRPG